MSFGIGDYTMTTGISRAIITSSKGSTEDEMTTALALICQDGLVLGTDMKATAGPKKWIERKILGQHTLAKRPLIIAGAGAVRHIRDAVRWLDLDDLDRSLQGNISPFDQLLERVEQRIPRFCQDYESKYGEEAESEFILAYIDKERDSHLLEIYSGGEYDHKDSFAAIGSGSIFGEILLRRLHHPDMSIETAKKLLGYIIWEIQGIDNYSGENMQILSLDKSGKVDEVPDTEIQAYKSLPKLVDWSYEHLRHRIERVDLNKVHKHLIDFDDLLGTMTDRNEQSTPTTEGNKHGGPNNTRQQGHQSPKERGKTSQGSTKAIDQG